MKYICTDEFMVRTPSLPFEYLLEFEKSNKDIYEFISENKELDIFFRRALIVSSKSLYYSYVKPSSNSKKYLNMCEGLLKYFLRATSRPTPYGYYADVSLGNFSQLTDFAKDYKILDIKVDMNWANSVIESLENNIDVLQHLELKFNAMCFISGDRLKNPYTSNRGSLDNSANVIRESNIKYTNLIRLIRLNSKYFIKFFDLFKLIKDEYMKVDDRLILDTIINLVENEYLYTNLKIPAYCDDSLGYMIRTLRDIESASKTYDILIEIDRLISSYKMQENPKIIEKIYKLMSSIHESKDYLEFNLGYQYKNNVLETKIKNKIEKFVDTLSHISVKSTTYGILDKVRNRFIDMYGELAEVDLTEIIDSNMFNGASLIKSYIKINDEREQIINEIIKNKIEVASMKGTNVFFTKDDFSNLDNTNIVPSKGFDLNLFITQEKDGCNLIVGPNGGASKVGAMFQRFNDCYNTKDYEKYLSVYKKVVALSKEDYIEVEL